MNWRRLYATCQILSVVWLLSIGMGIFWSFLLAGIVRVAFHLNEGSTLIFVAIPVAIAIAIWGVIYLPAHFRKAGILSDDPRKFGPWFEKKNEKNLN